MKNCEHVSTFEAAQYLHVSPSTVIRWCNDGLIEYHRTIGGDRRIPINEINRILEKHRNEKKYKHIRKKR